MYLPSLPDNLRGGFFCKFIQGLDGLFYKIKSDTIRIIRLFTDKK